MTVTTDPDRVAWTWRNCRSLTLSVDLEVMPWEWRLGLKRWEDNDYLQWKGWLCLGPLTIGLNAHTGNVSSESRWRAWFGLSDEQALERAIEAACKRARR